MKNPYEKVNWKKFMKIRSATHMHMTDQKTLKYGYKHGIRHFPISNYYPSAPYNSETRESDFKLDQKWPARKKNGKILEPPPVDWNKVIKKYWSEEEIEKLKEKLEKDKERPPKFPFEESGKVFDNIRDAIISPNAEHHNFCDQDLNTEHHNFCGQDLKNFHVCSLGSSFCSGNFDKWGYHGLYGHGFVVGFGGTWDDGFKCILKELKYDDGGGITINHPAWYSQLKEEHVSEMLDFDEKVLGIEIYNDSVRELISTEKLIREAPDEMAPGFSLNLWDKILSTGRRCWGFCVPDHGFEKVRSEKWIGKSILLVPETTEHNCLKAYREGQFYGCIKGENKEEDLEVIDFSATESAVFVKVNAPATIKFITEKEIVLRKGDHASYDIHQIDGKPNLTYLRVEVEDDSGERLFLQPIMFKRMTFPL